jgi:hypothetical protein
VETIEFYHVQFTLFPKLDNMYSQEPIACLCGSAFYSSLVVFRSKTPCRYDPLPVVYLYYYFCFVFLIVHSYLQFELLCL